MSSCLSGGGRAYGLDLQILKSPSTSWTSYSSSPSSTLSESSNSPVAISTRKPRTPRKRRNQTYNEAAALLSTANPKIFSTKHLTKPCKLTKPHNIISPFSDTPSEVLLPFIRVIENSGFLLNPPLLEKPDFLNETKMANSGEKQCLSPGEIDSKGCCSMEFSNDLEEDFDAESMLDEEIEEGIDSIMGKLSVENDSMKDSIETCDISQINSGSTCYGYPIGLGFCGDYNFFYGMRWGVAAIRNVDEGDWWRSPSVNVHDITPRFNKSPAEKKKKKVEKIVELKNLAPFSKEKPISSLRNNKEKDKEKENSTQKASKDESSSSPKAKPAGLLLKLNYDNVLSEWSDREFPFSDDMPGSDTAGNDVQARLAQIDLFSEGGVREASVMRYKEKRRTRLFSKKIRYQVRKVNADRRPRMKGRFVKGPNSPESEQG